MTIKERAHMLVNIAVQNGELIRPDACESCGKTQSRSLDGHHADYSQPLSVVWLCRSCHKRVHYPIVEEKWVSFYMEPELLMAAKLRCIDSGVTFKAFVALACREHLAVDGVRKGGE